MACLIWGWIMAEFRWLEVGVKWIFRWAVIKAPSPLCYHLGLSSGDCNNKCTSPLTWVDWSNLLGYIPWKGKGLRPLSELEDRVWFDLGHNPVQELTNRVLWRWKGIKGWIHQGSFWVFKETISTWVEMHGQISPALRLLPVTISCDLSLSIAVSFTFEASFLVQLQSNTFEEKKGCSCWNFLTKKVLNPGTEIGRLKWRIPSQQDWLVKLEVVGLLCSCICCWFFAFFFFTSYSVFTEMGAWVDAIWDLGEVLVVRNAKKNTWGGKWCLVMCF